MSEVGLRKFHRNNGIILVWFLAVQAVTGLLLAAGTLGGVPDSTSWFKAMTTIHTGWDPLGSIYRILLAVFTAVQGVTGIIIYFMIRSRAKR